ncbi:hypothetical protein BDP27DRAFT_1321999, partial [Rhodocollybia butyracea]
MKDSPTIPILKNFMQWGDSWMFSSLAWGLLAGVDLYRQDRTFFRHNIFVMRVTEPTGQPIKKNQISKSFKLSGSSFMTNEQVKQLLDNQTIFEEVDSWKNYEEKYPPRDDFVRVIQMLEGGPELRISAQQPIANIIERLGLTSWLGENATFTKNLQDGYEECLRVDLDTGNTIGYMNYAQKVHRETKDPLMWMQV